VLQDVQGSTRAVMSGTTVVPRHDFLPFGEEIGAGTGLRTTGQGFGVTEKIRQRYAMTERDDATGLDHTWWRKYESFSGRWTSPDPYRGSMSIADPQSFNRFSYVQNDPVNFVDPTGLYWAIDWGSCRTNWVWVAHVEGGGDWYDRGEICNLVWNDWPIMAEPPEPPVGGGPGLGEPPTQKTNKEKDPKTQRCDALRAQILDKAGKLLNELRKYNPARDGAGGPNWKPGGHFVEISQTANRHQERRNPLHQRAYKRWRSACPSSS
jgi:RHS repeat-associated protein